MSSEHLHTRQQRSWAAAFASFISSSTFAIDETTSLPATSSGASSHGIRTSGRAQSHTPNVTDCMTVYAKATQGDVAKER